jgi:hypothetical protein
VAELSLTSGPHEEHHEKPGDVQRNLMAMILLHHGEGKVDVGSHSRRGVNIPVFQEDWFGANDSVGKFFGQVVTKPPVCHHFLPVDEASRSEQESTRAN